jgi:hypothetical protein
MICSICCKTPRIRNIGNNLHKFAAVNKTDLVMKQITVVLFLAAALFLNGCASATKQFSKRLRGTWTVSSYGVESPTARSTGAPSVFGTITFNKDWSGSVENPSIFDNLTSRATSTGGKYLFRWSNTENIVVIRSEGSNVSKSWIVVTNKKDHQVWKSTDGANEVNTIELKR